MELIFTLFYTWAKRLR